MTTKEKKPYRRNRKPGLLGAKFTAACAEKGACEAGLAWLRGRPRTLANLIAKPDWHNWAINAGCLDAETATAGDSGTATAGYGGTATAGYSGTVMITGTMGVIVSRWWDGERWRMLAGVVGEDGLKKNTRYRCVDGKWVEVAS